MNKRDRRRKSRSRKKKEDKRELSKKDLRGNELKKWSRRGRSSLKNRSTFRKERTSKGDSKKRGKSN